jgi:hypothetical protein
MSFSSNPRQPSSGRTVDSALLVALYVLEASAVLAALAINRYFNLLGTPNVRQLTVIAAPFVLALGSGVYVAIRLVRARRPSMFAVALNLVAVLLVFGGSELVVRLFSEQTLAGPTFAQTLLLPRNWDELTARHRAIRAHPPSHLSYLEPDDLLGWVPSRNRQSTDGLYAINAEGLRSARPDVVYADRDPQARVAIVGDSFTFGLEVPFESSWGAALETALGRAAVLNFGVDGYGVDQALLRYERDARQWKPRVSIFSFIVHDLLRTVSVYPFITFPDWDLSAKPRFTLRDGALERVTDKLPRPEEILAAPSIADLPHLSLEPGYNPDEWGDRFYDGSYALRFLFSTFPRWPLPRKAPDSELAEINVALLSRFVRIAAADGAVPLVVFLPDRADFTGDRRPTRERVLSGLRGAGVEFMDLTSCVGSVGVERAFIPEHLHYSAEGNAIVAQCLLPHVRNAIALAEDRARPTADRRPD